MKNVVNIPSEYAPQETDGGCGGRGPGDDPFLSGMTDQSNT